MRMCVVCVLVLVFVFGIFLLFLVHNECACVLGLFFFFKQKTAYEMRISDWSSDVCPSDLVRAAVPAPRRVRPAPTAATPESPSGREAPVLRARRASVLPKYAPAAAIRRRSAAAPHRVRSSPPRHRSSSSVEGRIVGKEWVRSGRPQCAPDHQTKKTP